MLTSARDQLRSAAATDVLIIEDEPIIAMDIEELVASCGHRVVGVAATEADAVAIAGAQPARADPGRYQSRRWRRWEFGRIADHSKPLCPGYLRDGLPGAAPDRGSALEPAFVITKPFEPLTLAIATYQAVTGGVHLE